MVRIIVVWAQIAPQRQPAPRRPDSTRSTPSRYPAANWAPYDEMIELAHGDGLGVDLTLSGGAPRWAEGPGIPAAALDNQFWAWRPSAAAFGQFVRAAGERYSGTLRAAGTDRPAAPRELLGGLERAQLRRGPRAAGGRRVDRVGGAGDVPQPLAGQMWNALQATGHGRRRHDPDRRVRRAWPERPRRTPAIRRAFPATSDRPSRSQFLRTLYCVDSNYRELRGRAARAVGCPTTAAGSRSFRRQNPALFNATGFADHPYPDNDRPRQSRPVARSRTIAHVLAAPQPRARARPAPARVRLRQALPDLQHRVRLHHPPAEPPSVRLAGDRRLLHQLGRVPELEAAAGRHRRCSTCCTTRHRPPPPPWRRRLHERPADRQRQAQAGLRRLPPAAVPAGHLDAARPLARGVGVRAAGALRDPRRRAGARPDSADGADPVRAGLVGGASRRSGP